MSSESVFEKLVDAIMTFEVEPLFEATKEALEQGVNPVDIVEKSITKALQIVGDKFEQGEYFLMHLVVAGEAVTKTMTELIKPALKKTSTILKSAGIVVIGTVQGDIHDIGKNIVSSMLITAGFDVHDLGQGVSAAEFVQKAKELNAHLIGASALLSTTMPIQREIVELLEKEGLHGKIRVLVGGAPATSDWAEEIGADGYADNAIEAAKVAKALLGIQE